MRKLSVQPFTQFFNLALVCALSACASSARNERAAKDYALVGAAAEANGDWSEARFAFARATSSADLAQSSAERRAVLHYEYGRALGVTCFFDQAETELLRAYDLDKQAEQPLFRSLLELARLNLDQRKFIIAASYFERAFLALDDAKTARSAPLVYADVLDEYALALTGAGRAGDSAAVTKRAAELRGINASWRAIADRTPYGQHCSKS